MKPYVLIYFLSALNGGAPTTVVVADFRNVYSCEQAAAQIHASVAQHAAAKVTTLCLSRAAYAMHWKGKPIQPGTGRVGK